MNKCRVWLGVLAFGLALPVGAQEWRGWQAGVGLGLAHVRGAIRSGSVFVSPGYSPTGGTFFAAETVPQLSAIGEVSRSEGAAAPGVAMAWNTQEAGFVRGWMLDMARMSLHLRSEVSQNYLACCTASGFTLRQSIDTTTLVAVRARAGWVQGNWLWYGSAGVALTDLRFRSDFQDRSEEASVGLSHSRWRAGLALGLGAERQVGSSWSWRLEWLWADFGNVRRQTASLSSPWGTYPNSPWITQARLRADRLSVSLQRHW